ncbi:hypothetical protein K402DRAFT_329661 [Aulographum hederae CBS 113979]|uniref:Non-structural maintenance of chromosomes element 4 n=1 Tax=Aulographum hederae CBS 113979 TaxID=1176131 RepID=A0A6G1H4D0_9PEZI|nr:hypothetical protein K402DRAFT_329661 [Aulographum hederae CBS 113979]
MEKGKGKRPISQSQIPTPESEEARAKRRRTNDSRSPVSDDEEEQEPDEEEEGDEDEKDQLDYYNPDQPEEERRAVREAQRSHMRYLIENGDELSKPDSRELQKRVEEIDADYKNVRQTTDAAIDSANIVKAAEYVLKGTTQIAHGDGATGIDLEDFVSKCKLFMINGGPPELEDGDDGSDDELPASQARRRRRRQVVDLGDNDEGDDDGDALRWDVLGDFACFMHTKRPPVTGFLLGPLSVQKKVRATQQRRAALGRNTQAVQTQPQELQVKDLERAESSNLTTLCKNILARLQALTASGIANMEAEDEDMSEEEARNTFKKHGLATNWEVPFFEFAINPDSFSQTVENIFYISFLVREGEISIGKDDVGLPTLRPEKPRTIDERREENVTKNQAIFSMDFATWETLIELLQIEEPRIPHREDDGATQVNAKGWYA